MRFKGFNESHDGRPRKTSHTPQSWNVQLGVGTKGQSCERTFPESISGGFEFLAFAVLQSCDVRLDNVVENR